MDLIQAGRLQALKQLIVQRNRRFEERRKGYSSKERKLARSRSEKAHHKFNVYFTAMPTIGYQRVESNQNDNLIIQSIKQIPAFSTSRLGVRMELGAETPISKRMKVFAGLLYYQRKQTIDYVEKRVENTTIIAGPDGEVMLNPQFKYENKSFQYELRNVGVQIGLNFQLSKNKFLQIVGTGIEFQVALNKLNESDKIQGFTTNPSAYVFYNLYYRLQYPAEGRLKAIFQPTLNYSFYIDQNLNAPFYVKPYGLGLNLGVTYNF